MPTIVANLPTEDLPLRTDRLRLRRLRTGDASLVARHVGDWDVAKQTGDTPFPYNEAAARDWIGREARLWTLGRGCALAVEHLTGERFVFVGTISLRIRRGALHRRRGEAGYWIGKPHWGQGFATEALRAAVPWFAHGYNVRRVEAVTFTDNAASCAVLEKTGFRHTRNERRDYPERGGLRLVRIYAWSRR